MKWFLVLPLLFSSLVHAETMTSKVHSIDGNILKFSNGRVAFLKKSVSVIPGSVIKANLNSNSDLTSFEVVSSGEEEELSLASMLEETTPPPFEPSIVPSMDEANAIFNRSNPFFKRVSECSDRAHVWAHDEFKRSGTKSMKAFVFFTASYINSVRFKWWFHVAPMYKVQDGGSIKDIVMDFRYTERPLTVKEWTDRFVYTKRECKVTTRFSEYDVNPQTENCYLMFDSMHYRLPGELADQEKGRYKSVTTESELRNSFKWAFEK